MRTVSDSVVCLVCILIVSVGAHAQGRTILKAELDKIFDRSVRLLSTKPHRVTTSTVTYVPLWRTGRNKSGTLTEKIIKEVLPRVGTRTVSESRGGTVDSQTEWVSIGRKLYTRDRAGKWTVATLPRKSGPAKGSKSEPNRIDPTMEYRFLGGEILGERDASVYRVTQNSRPVKDSKAVRNRTRKYWFGRDGVLLKSETTTEYLTLGEPSVMTVHSITLIEPDPKIEIRAPELK